MANDLFLLLAQADSGGWLESLGLLDLGSQALLWFRVALGIGLVIFVHELGHFVAAKTFGVKCEKFYVGFDPPMKFGPIKLPSSLGKFRFGETEYGIGIIPLGGYVKMLGQDDDPRRMKEEVERARRVAAENADGDVDPEDIDIDSLPLDPRSLPAKPVWQRMIIMSAGVFMNVITGIMFAGAAYFGGVPYTPAIVGGVSPGGPAWKADIEPGGEVVSIDGLEDSQMHFREMRSAILHAGLEEPDRPVPLTLVYGNSEAPQSEVEYSLTTEPLPQDDRLRIIGIIAPGSETLSSTSPATENSIASTVVDERFAGAKLDSYAGKPLDLEAIVPINAFYDHLYSNPDQDIELTFTLKEDVQSSVTLPPQVSKWIGIRSVIGPVTDLVGGGPAEAAGMKIDDVVTAVGGAPVDDAEALLLAIANRKATRIAVKRGDETIELEINPDDSLQTLPPTTGVGLKASVNAYGFAFSMPAKVAAFDDGSKVDGDTLEDGATLRKIQLIESDKLPEELLKQPILLEAIEKLEEGWEFSEEKTVSAFFESIQFLPTGTKFKVLAEQPSGVIADLNVELKEDENRVRFDRGLVFAPAEMIQTASGVQEASMLGIREAKRRLGEVMRFLGMASRGKISADQVGGPVRIFQVAGSEAEQGISKQLLFLTMLSMNLAILNFLPIPVLDGGHMVFLIAEAVMGKRVNEELEMRLTMVGACMLLALMIFVFFNDIINII
ncbi:MAG: site-2 protease family protein [Planctomycetota bacterium]